MSKLPLPLIGLVTVVVAGSGLAATAFRHAAEPSATQRGTVLAAPISSLSAAVSAAPVHCQVPCGIYGDRMRIDMMLEDSATIEKGMGQITELGAAGDKNFNQIVRWVMTKDEHAQSIQDQVAAYWLAQRIKPPKDESDAAGQTKYLQQLELMHRITVAAMRCKQTTDAENAVRIRELASKFAKTYFSEEDLKHLEDHKDGR